MLEAFRLIEIVRLPAERGGRATSAYGNVSIIRERIDEKEARERKKQVMAAWWNEMLLDWLTAIQE